MNPEKTGALQLATALVEGLVARGLAGVVMSPGSRNAPLVQAVTQLAIEQAVTLDERAAGHHALGMAWALRRPVAVCCTSGTAALNVDGPALAEAHRSSLPLVSITADRPRGAHGEWQSQTLVQEGVHAAHVCASFTWEPRTSEEAAALLDEMADALLGGPIHVNCPFDEPLYPISDAPTTGATDGDASDPARLPVPQVGDASATWVGELRAALERGDRIMLLGGTQWRPLSAEALKTWARHALLVGDSTSGMALEGVPVLTACDRWFGAWSSSGKSWDDYRPDLIVTFGTPLLSRRLKAQLAEGVRGHVHLDPAGFAPDAFGIPCRNVALNPATALQLGADLLTGAPAADRPAWTAPWWTLEAALSVAHGGALDAAPWSDLIAHHILHGALPNGWDLHLGNSTPVRYAQLFPDVSCRHPWSNRGVAGIDGCSSTAVGAALAGRDTTLITGELGFLYDANAFHIHPVPANLRIAVIHNGGGGIFRWLDGPERTGLVESHFEWQHDTELRPLCDLHGIIHERVSDATALRNALDLWWQPSEAPKVLEIATPSESSAAAYKAYMQAVRPGSPGRAIGTSNGTRSTSALSIRKAPNMAQDRNWEVIKDYEDIHFEFFEGIARITIDRQQVYNAFRPETNMEMLDAMDICRERQDIGVVVLTGAGDKAFCSGGDQNVKGVGGYIGGDGVPRLNVLDLHRKMRSLPKPVIAAVNGYAIGGGHVLHVVCDLTIASENAIFGQTGPKVGSFDAGFGSSYLARHVGQKKAREIWFLCEQYSAKEAEAMGMVNTVVPLEKLEDTYVKWCKTIMKRSPLAIRMLKRALNAELDGQAGMMEFAGDATLMYYLMEEAQEGKNAFLEKRDPDFQKYPKFP